MQRLKLAPRNKWQAEVEKIGFGFHTTDLVYWDESVCYTFTNTEVAAIEAATNKLWEMCLTAVQHVIDNYQYEKFQIPEKMIPYLEKTWNEDVPSIYGRFDLCVKDGKIKLLEFNADTPTSLFEAGIVQWFWLQDYDANKDQFNSIHEKLIAYWQYLKVYLHPGTLHFSCLRENLEDLTNTEYLRDCSIQAGLDTKLVFIEDLGWDSEKQHFVDLEEQPIKNIFKLYPWEWMSEDQFGENILKDKQKAFWIEPSWKMLLSNKAILAVLWELFPNHEYLLPTFFEEKHLKDYVKKPLLSREGANIELIRHHGVIEKTQGIYGKEGFVYQQLFTLPDFDGNYPVVGSWVIGQEAAGIGIRESTSLITDNQSRFVPHYIG